ncbi:helix-turn-helix domain-containing protein [Campylobacter concisus]|uniref:helix-turn-helix domain-containing protein n=1 Tax=Campylobacter concisus TaxID=199 RepID=UPI00122C99A3|nr:helix-turn-helix domain-containing protein [Campylobacter concisus]
MSQVDEILARVRFSLGVKNDTGLAEILEIPYKTLDGWKTRGAIPRARLLEISAKLNVSPQYLESGINVSNGHFINGNNVSVGNYHIGQSSAKDEDIELINAIKENDPNREYKNLEDLKKRLFIKTNDEFMKIFQLTREELKKITFSGIPQEMAAAAHAIERKIRGILLDPGEATGLNEYGLIKIEGGTRELVGDDIKIAYLLAYANKEFKQNVLKKLEAFRELSKI